MRKLCFFLLGWLALYAAAPAVVNVGTRLELFVDDTLIDKFQGAELRLHSPQSAGAALVFDRPWEGAGSAIVSVFKDGARYRMYYRGSGTRAFAVESLLKQGETLLPDHENVTCYAESADGIHWTRPNLGMHDFQGSKNNNILRKDEFSDNWSVFLDAKPGIPPGERYKAVASKNLGTAKKRKQALFAFASGDGLHWRQLGDQPILTDGYFDTQNVVTWDAHRKKYIAFYRDFDRGIRSFKISTSEDFAHWAPGVWADFGNTPEEQLYTIGATAYHRAPHIFLSFPRRFVTYRSFPPDAKVEGVSDVVFLSSRDGFHWDRRFMEAYLRAGIEERNWTHRSNAPGVGLLETGPHELSMYVSRHLGLPTHFLERFTVRTDGFVSLHAGYAVGEAVTKPLVFTGKKLVLNYSTSAVGGVRIEIQDVNGNPLPGYALEDCPPMFGDSVEGVVRWSRSKTTRPYQPGSPAGEHDATPVGALANKPVRLRFVLKDADIYSFQFQ